MALLLFDAVSLYIVRERAFSWAGQHQKNFSYSRNKFPEKSCFIKPTLLHSYILWFTIKPRKRRKKKFPFWFFYSGISSWDVVKSFYDVYAMIVLTQKLEAEVSLNLSKL